MKIKLYLLFLISVVLILSGCAAPVGAPPGGVLQGGGASSGTSEFFSEGALGDESAGFAIAAAAAAAGVVSGGVSFGGKEKKDKKEKPVIIEVKPNKKRVYNPTLMFYELPFGALHYLRAGYVIFPHHPENNLERSLTFCEALKGRFVVKNTLAGKSAEGEDYPTIWPIKLQSGRVIDCNKAVAKYDYPMIKNFIDQNAQIPTGRGPILLAMDASFKSKSVFFKDALYWDLTEFEVDDFMEQVDNWFTIVSFSEDDERLMVLNELNNNELFAQIDRTNPRVY